MLWGKLRGKGLGRRLRGGVRGRIAERCYQIHVTAMISLMKIVNIYGGFRSIFFWSILKLTRSGEIKI
jgi:hypothetical protein